MGEREGGGGNESSNTAQRYQQPNREEAPQTLMQDNKKVGFVFQPICCGLISSGRFALGDFVPPGVASFYHQMRHRNIHSL